MAWGGVRSAFRTGTTIYAGSTITSTGYDVITSSVDSALNGKRGTANYVGSAVKSASELYDLSGSLIDIVDNNGLLRFSVGGSTLGKEFEAKVVIGLVNDGLTHVQVKSPILGEDFTGGLTESLGIDSQLLKSDNVNLAGRFGYDRNINSITGDVILETDFAKYKSPGFGPLNIKASSGFRTIGNVTQPAVNIGLSFKTPLFNVNVALEGRGR